MVSNSIRSDGDSEAKHNLNLRRPWCQGWFHTRPRATPEPPCSLVSLREKQTRVWEQFLQDSKIRNHVWEVPRREPRAEPVLSRTPGLSLAAQGSRATLSRRRQPAGTYWEFRWVLIRQMMSSDLETTRYSWRMLSNNCDLCVVCGRLL